MCCGFGSVGSGEVVLVISYIGVRCGEGGDL